jgi:zinc protease
MKKIISFFVILFIGLQMFAQMGMGTLPIDPNTKKGVLDNGMTYYIRANQEPRGQAEFFIAQKVGSIEENESQRGLAHFLEHMAFNGLQHFPDKDLFKFTEGIGVKFGYNLNAYTSFDRTVYNISAVPISREGIIDSCLLVLYDWACGLMLEQDAINEERGVIREEMRTRDNASMRIYEKIGLQVMPGNIYSVRWPIGLESVIMNFKRQEIVDYYHKWYRPDHQGIIIIGDFDADKIEAKVKELFGRIPKPAEAQELVIAPCENNEEPLVAVETDLEMTQSGISINFKHEVMPVEVKLSQAGLILGYVNSIISSIFSERFDEIVQKPNAPFMGAYGYNGSFFLTNQTDAFSATANCKEGGIEEAYKALVTELTRVKQHGFTAGEYERAKSEYLSNLEKSYNERNTRKSGSYAQECVRNFVDDEVMPGIETEYGMLSQVVPHLDVNVINQMVQGLITDENIAIYAYGPKKDGLAYPTKERLVELYKQIMVTEVAPLEDKVSDEPLIAKLPKKGKISKKTTDAKYGATVYTLSNGIKVIAKKTDFKDDEILFTASSFGGYSLFDLKDAANLKALNAGVISIGGYGNFSATDLNKTLAGKIANVGTGVGELTQNINGSCTPKFMETMFQLIYLKATAPRYDEEAFQSWAERTKSQLAQQSLNPMMDFLDTLYSEINNRHPFKMMLKAEDIDKVDYKRCLELYKQRLANMGNFTFTFVGNIDEKIFENYLAQYIAVLPTTKAKETWKDLGIVVPNGLKENKFTKEVETPKATIALIYHGVDAYSPLNVLKYKITGEILDMVYTREVREKEGGTYGVSVQCELERLPKEEYSLLYYFDTDIEKAASLLPIFEREMKKIAAEGPEQEHWDKTIEYLKKENTQNKRENRAWMRGIAESYLYGTDSFLQAEQLLESVKQTDIQNIVAKILKDNNLISIEMDGVKKN